MRDIGGVCNVPDIAPGVSTAVYAGVCARYSLVWSFHTNLPTAGSTGTNHLRAERYSPSNSALKNTMVVQACPVSKQTSHSL